MDVDARTAVHADLDVLAVLAESAIEELTANRGGPVWSQFEARPRPVRARLGEQIEDPATLVAAGTISEVVVGYAVGEPATGHDGRLMVRLSDLYVQPDARGVGVGECLMDQVVRWAGERGASGIDSIALPGDRATKNFFESFGLVARAIVVHRAL